MKPTTAVAWTVGLGVGTLVLYTILANRQEEETSYAAPRAHNPRVATTLDLGLAVDNRGVYIADLSKWFQETPAAFEEAMVAGAAGPQAVLVHVLRRALPHLHWPPVASSPHYEQFQDLLRIVAEELPFRSPEPPDRHLKVVS